MDKNEAKIISRNLEIRAHLLKLNEEKMKDAFKTFTNSNLRLQLLRIARSKIRKENMLKTVDRRTFANVKYTDFRKQTANSKSQKNIRNAQSIPPIIDLLPNDVIESLQNFGSTLGHKKGSMDRINERVKSTGRDPRENFHTISLESIPKTKISFKSQINRLRCELIEKYTAAEQIKDNEMTRGGETFLNMVLEILEEISKEHKIFGDILSKIIHEIKKYAMIEENEFFTIFPICNELHEFTRISGISNCRISFYEAINIIVTEFVQYYKKSKEKISILENENSIYKEEIYKMKEIVEKMKNSIQNYETETGLKRKFLEISEDKLNLQENITNLRIAVQKLEFDNNKISSELLTENISKSNILEEFKKLKKHDSKLEMQNTELQGKYNKIKDEFQIKTNLLAELMKAKKLYENKIYELKNDFNNLEDEYQKLADRKSAVYEDLTPRYANFEKIFEELKLEKPKSGYIITEKISSISYIEEIIKKLRELLNIK